MKTEIRYDLTLGVPHQEEATASGKQLKRIGNRGHTQSCNLKDNSSIEVFQDNNLLATWKIIPQYWQTDHWEDYTKTQDFLSIVDGHLVAEGVQGGFSWDVDIAWTADNSKWQIHVVAPGFLFRFKWNIIFTSLGQTLMANRTLRLEYDDYPGEISDDAGIVERNIIFEPNGVENELIVDPYLGLTTDATYITVDFTDSEQAVWTIATENAQIIHKNDPIYVVISEDYYWWACYPDKLVRFRHNTGATTTGMALDGGNTYAIAGNLTQVGSTEMYFYPCDLDTYNNKAAIAAAWLSANYPTITDGKGSIITDMIVPETIDADAGFASSAEYYLNLDVNDHNAKLTFHQTEREVAVLLGGPSASIRTGAVANPIEHCKLHLKCEDNAASSVIVATVGTNAVWRNTAGTERNTNTAGDSVDVKKGKGFDTQSRAAWIDMAAAEFETPRLAKGTFIISIKPQMAYTVAISEFFLTFYIDSSNFIYLYYSQADDQIGGRIAWGAVSSYPFLPDVYTSDDQLHVLKTFLICWDADEDFTGIYDGHNFYWMPNTGTPGTGSVTYSAVANFGDGDNPVDGLVDEAKLYDICLVPFGTFISGNLEDFTKAHSDIIWYWACDSDTVDIGSNIESKAGDYLSDGVYEKGFNPTVSTGFARITLNGDLLPGEGSLLMWVDDMSALTADGHLFYTLSDFNLMWDDSAGNFVFTYGTASVQTDSTNNPTPTGHNCVRIGWKASTEIYIEVNGMRITNTTSIPTAPTLGTYMFFCASDNAGSNLFDTIIDEVFITSSLRTPELPTAFGVPLHAPQIWKK